MSVDIDKLFEEGQRLLIKRHREEEAKKVGLFRAGNTGMLLGDGRVVGRCPRLTVLRSLGVDADSEEDLSRELMFDSGRTNEDAWFNVLKYVWPGPILREEEIPIEWTTKAGTKVTGRPDLVLCNYKPPESEGLPGEIQPVKGIELKLVSSLWTARDILGGEPKMIHLLQAAHYMWQLKVPFELWYTSRVDWPITGWAVKLFKELANAYADIIILKNGEPFKLLPFRAGFELRVDQKNFVEYRFIYRGYHGPWHKSIANVDQILNYFEYVDSLKSAKRLGVRPTNLSTRGENGGYKICDYCPLQEVCDTYEKKGFDVWLKEVERRNQK